MRKLICCLFFAGAASMCFGQAPGAYSLNLGLNFSDQARKKPTFRNKESIPSTFQFWLLKSFAMRVQTPLLLSKVRLPSDRRVSGRGDTSVGAAFTLVDIDQTHPFAIQLDYKVKLPSAIKGLGSDQTDHQALAIFNTRFLKDDKLQLEFDGGTLMIGRKGKTSASSPQFSFIETYGLVALEGTPKNFKWLFFNENDYAPAAAGNPSSFIAIHQLVYVHKDVTFRFGPNYALTPYDSRFGFAVGVKYRGQLTLKH
jgi:hypothetical protein